jgi:hypothetical protein
VSGPAPLPALLDRALATGDDTDLRAELLRRARLSP